MLKEWEQNLLADVLQNPGRYNGNRCCNDWYFPSWMTKEQEDEMILKCAYANDGGEEIHKDYGSEEEYLKNRGYVMNFEVSFYLFERLKEEGFVMQDPLEYDG